MRGETLIASIFLALSGITFASSRQQVTIENRTLDQIYQAALKESRPLTVVRATATVSTGRAGPGPAHFCWPLTLALPGRANLSWP